MKKCFLLAMGTCIVLTLAGCPPSAPSVRDYIAAYSGYVQSATTKHTAECTVNSSATTCQIIKKSAAALNAGITARETWCGLSHNLPSDPGAVCIPQKSAEGVL